MFAKETAAQSTLFKPQAPEYTIRLLLGNIHSESKETPKLKRFSHFTLGCTQKDESVKVKASLEKLAAIFKSPITFKAESVVNLGSKDQPLWGISMKLGSNEKNLLTLFSEQFDSIMCPEKTGVLYLWEPSLKGSEQRSVHITIGPRKEDFEMGNKLLELNCEFVFTQMDYKKVGPNDPHVTITLEHAPSTSIRLSSETT